MKVKMILFGSFILTIFASIAYTDYLRGNKISKGFRCFSQVQYDYAFNGQLSVLNAGMMFILEDGRGLVTYTGNFNHNGKRYVIKRNADISYTEINKNSFLIKSDKVKVAPFDTLPDDLAQRYLYSYMRDNGGWFNIGVQRNAENGYLISTTPIPQFLCKSVK